MILSESSSDIEVDDKKYINSLHKNEINLNVSDNEFSTISEKHKSVKEVLNKKKLKDLNEIDNSSSDNECLPDPRKFQKNLTKSKIEIVKKDLKTKTNFDLSDEENNNNDSKLSSTVIPQKSLKKNDLEKTIEPNLNH